MELHRHIHEKAAIEKKHFDQWLQLFTQTIDAHFEGPNATLMKQRAASIATLMQLKFNGQQLKNLT
jgi:hemoglobin